MIFRIHIPKDSEQLELAHKIRSLLINNQVKTSTYIPEDAEIGLKVHKIINKKLLGQIFGLIQRGGYEVEQISSGKSEFIVSSPQRKQKTMEINTRKQI